jgi:hypothetical protein
LRNNQGRGLEIKDKQRHGMIRDAKWADIDGDKDLDIIMCGDWMNITVMQNDKGKFTEITEKLGLNNLKGFWNCVGLYDYNKDGVLDIVAGNSGINHKYVGTKDQPIKMYVGDFDKNGATEPLIFYHYFKRYIPFASMDKLLSQAPSLKKKFNSYSNYKEVDDIGKMFENYKENQIEYKEVNESRSVIFLSDKGKYVSYPLPFQEQMSDIQDIYIEANGDMVYVGNNKNYMAENGGCTSNSGRKLSGFDIGKRAFTKSERLSLPLGLNTRYLRKVSDGKYAVSSNEEYIYTFATAN